jgi:hypothetical protein
MNKNSKKNEKNYLFLAKIALKRAKNEKNVQIKKASKFRILRLFIHI